MAATTSADAREGRGHGPLLLGCARRDLTDRCSTLTAGGGANRRNRPQPLVTGLSSASQTSRPPARL